MPGGSVVHRHRQVGRQLEEIISWHWWAALANRSGRDGTIGAAFPTGAKLVLQLFSAQWAEPGRLRSCGGFDYGIAQLAGSREIDIVQNPKFRQKRRHR